MTSIDAVKLIKEMARYDHTIEGVAYSDTDTEVVMEKSNVGEWVNAYDLDKILNDVEE